MKKQVFLNNLLPCILTTAPALDAKNKRTLNCTLCN